MTAVRQPPRPRETLDRCALRAQLRGDWMLGTAFPAARLLLVEQPGAWGRNGLRSSRFDPEVAVTLENQARENGGVRVQAIRRPGRTPRGATRRWIYVDTRDGHETQRWGYYDLDAELLDLPLDGSVGEVDHQLSYLSCANGKHDPCCAVRGRTVAAALHDIRPGQVWEASHLGGDRFAANVLVLPTGLMYGRVLPFAATDFVRAAEDDVVLGPLLRGRIGVPPVVQAALGYAHEQLGLPHRRDLRFVDSEKLADGTMQVRLDSAQGRYAVQIVRERVDATGLTCAAPGPSWFVAHRPVRIAPSD